jgi:hypothetical protein
MGNLAQISRLARQSALQYPAIRCGSILIYRIPSLIFEDIGIDNEATQKVRTYSEMLLACENIAVDTILIPRGSSFTMSLLQDLCRQQGQTKTVYYEGMNDE